MQISYRCVIELHLYDRVGGVSIRNNVNDQNKQTYDIHSQKYNLDMDVNCIYMCTNDHYSNFQMMQTRPESQISKM